MKRGWVKWRKKVQDGKFVFGLYMYSQCRRILWMKELGLKLFYSGVLKEGQIVTCHPSGLTLDFTTNNNGIAAWWLGRKFYIHLYESLPYCDRDEWF